MSRVGKNPVSVPENVEVTLSASEVLVKGPLGTLRHHLVSDIAVERDGGNLLIKASNDSKQANAMSGTMRALLANMVHGVTKGFEKKLLLVGVGYRAQAAGEVLNLTLGFSHPVAHKMPDGVKAETPSQTEILIKGIDKQQVGQVAAEIRAYRRPEPYKGKGVRYANEVIVMKETKKK
ncbi:LSU ribosomal protein L6P [Nitrosospira sp. Nsp5]|jgi:large subunit ribosomal protein L6|uniref:Large ribosomal subunit protein uL6 n=1 Tax=Nitrosospira multiformis TaxID=1231 RepID=A0ABY0TJR1_9PROT|nr:MULTISPECIES: 50S ribosomal protein L6 [Nitrosospira]PTR10279.1 LSU ribosomal protein L6P [Nitrosospira sp. Nsp5]SDQ93494.1 LSU ribosomal protein L6P [Nitrosospira multiformis]